jgi:hypothetical protein
MANFQHKHKKAGSIFKKYIIMEASMFPLRFDEFNKKFEKNNTIKIGTK